MIGIGRYFIVRYYGRETGRVERVLFGFGTKAQARELAHAMRRNSALYVIEQQKTG